MANYRLTETMESRIHRKVYVRFGGEYPETQHRNMKLGVGYLAYKDAKDLVQHLPVLPGNTNDCLEQMRMFLKLFD